MTCQQIHPAHAHARNAACWGAFEQLDYGEAYVNALLGHADRAIPLLEKYLRTNPALGGQVRNSPWFTSLRRDPRFVSMTAPR